MQKLSFLCDRERKDMRFAILFNIAAHFEGKKEHPPHFLSKKRKATVRTVLSCVLFVLLYIVF